MKLGNILAGIGIVFCLIGYFCLPLYNLHELPFIGKRQINPIFTRAAVGGMMRKILFTEVHHDGRRSFGFGADRQAQ